MAKTAGDLRAWAFVGALALTAVVRPWGCVGPSPADTDTDDVLGAVLADTWPVALAPALARARTEAELLLAACEAWAAAERSGDGEAARADAQAAWRATMDAWQEVEVMQVGPLGSSVTAVGGRDLRDAVYSWPTVNRCRVDQETVAARWDEPDFFATSLVNVLGLDALETLLFSPPGDNSCPSQVDINSSGAWAALGTDGAQQNRADYAVALSGHLVATIDAVEVAWDPAGGDFAAAFAGGHAPYESREQALNAIFDALFYVELRTKDRKLGGPLGLRDCGATSCLADVETTLAGGSHAWIAANLRGFRALFTAGDGAGMEDLLRDLGHDALADEVLAALDAADAAAAALTVPVDVAATTDPEPAIELHAKIGALTDLLKSDVAVALTMQIPSEAAGDVD